MIEFFAEHTVKMLLTHCKKFTAAEITERVKITKQEIVALVPTSNEMLLLLIMKKAKRMTFVYYYD